MLMTPAQTLRKAAYRIRSTMPITAPGHPPDTRWHLEMAAVGPDSGVALIVAQGRRPQGVGARHALPTRYIADAASDGEAAWLALMDPMVGRLLADWLDQAAAAAEAFEASFGPDLDQAAAAFAAAGGARPLALARALLAEVEVVP